MLYRPDSADAADLEFAEALQLCERDAELKRWFDEHCAVYRALRARFRQTPVPEALKEQILAERKVHTTVLRPKLALLAAAVAIVALVSLAIRWWPETEDTSYPAYCERMVSFALRNYYMPVITNDPAQIRAFLGRNGAPSDFTMPQALQKATLLGCAIEPWQGDNVSMVCFDTGQPHPPGQVNDLWLFVIDRSKVPDAPVATTPQLTKVNRATTATWSEGNHIYLLVADGDEQFLRKYL